MLLNDDKRRLQRRERVGIIEILSLFLLSWTVCERFGIFLVQWAWNEIVILWRIWLWQAGVAGGLFSLIFH